jgi:hemin uptake protein HemP
MYSMSAAGEPKLERVADGSEKAHRHSRSLDSQDLFSGAGTVHIQHRGVTYTLRQTRNASSS